MRENSIQNGIIAKNQEKKEFIYIFVTNVVVVVVTYGLFFQLKFAVDTYSHIYMTSSDFLWGHLGSGRPLAAAICVLLCNLGINDGLQQIPYAIFLTLAIALSSALIYRQLKKYIGTDNIISMMFLDLISLFPFINVFFCSWYMYTEASIITGIGIILTVYGAILVVDERNKNRNLILALLCVFLSLCIYQVFMSFFVILACMFVVTKHQLKCCKKSILEIIAILTIAVLSIVLNQVATNLLCKHYNIALSGRTASFDLTTIGKNIENIFSFLPSLWINGLNMLPHYSLVVFFVLIISLWLIAIIMTRNTSVISILMCIAIVLGSFVLLFSPHLVSPVFWPAERTFFPIFCIFSFVLSVFLCYKNNTALLHIALIICLCFFVINIVEIQDIAGDQQIVNSIDEEYSKMIGHEIEKYENESGLIVKKVGVALDKHPSHSYNSQVDKVIYDTNIAAKSVDWSIVPMLRYYLNRDLMLINTPPQIMNQYFKDQDWNTFIPSAQIIFQEDTVYICAY